MYNFFGGAYPMMYSGWTPLYSLFSLMALWTLFWKAWALWIAARKGQKIWYGVLLIVNLAGVLEILYIFIFSKKDMKEIKDKIMATADKKEDGVKMTSTPEEKVMQTPEIKNGALMEEAEKPKEEMPTQEAMKEVPMDDKAVEETLADSMPEFTPEEKKDEGVTEEKKEE